MFTLQGPKMLINSQENRIRNFFMKNPMGDGYSKFIRKNVKYIHKNISELYHFSLYFRFIVCLDLNDFIDSLRIVLLLICCSLLKNILTFTRLTWVLPHSLCSSHINLLLPQYNFNVLSDACLILFVAAVIKIFFIISSVAK